jgi:hypothetical protein
MAYSTLKQFSTTTVVTAIFQMMMAIAGDR